MKVLHILHHVSWNLEGWHTYIAKGLERLPRRLEQVCFTPITYQSFSDRRIGRSNIFSYRNFSFPFFRTIMWSNRMYIDLLKYARNGWIIHVHGERGTIPLFLSKFAGGISKIVLQQHSGIPFGIRSKFYSFYKYYLNSRSIKRIIVPSYMSMNFLKYKGVERDKIFPLSPGVGFDELIFKPFNKKEAREILRLRKDVFIILYVGRFSNIRGFESIIDIARMLKNRGVYS